MEPSKNGLCDECGEQGEFIEENDGWRMYRCEPCGCEYEKEE